MLNLKRFLIIFIIILLVNSISFAQVIVAEGILADESFIEIKNSEDLANIKDDLTEDYILTQDIDLKDAEWEPIDEGEFTGTLIGDDFIIQNMPAQYSEAENYGLFTEVKDINNIDVEVKFAEEEIEEPEAEEEAVEEEIEEPEAEEEAVEEETEEPEVEEEAVEEETEEPEVEKEAVEEETKEPQVDKKESLIEKFTTGEPEPVKKQSEFNTLLGDPRDVVRGGNYGQFRLQSNSSDKIIKMIGEGGKNSFKNIKLAHTASLTNVQLLSNVEITAGLTEQTEHYDLALRMTGEGLADIELVGPERVGVFYIPELAGKMQADGPANVRVEILPITMEDLPALNTAVGGLTGTATNLVGGVVSALDTILGKNPLLKPLVDIQGLDGINTAIDNLNNLDTALAKLIAYEGEGDVVVNSDGSVVVDFSDGLGQHLDTAVNDVVKGLVNDLLAAVGNLEIRVLDGVGAIPILGPILVGVVNDLILGGIVGGLLEGITDGLQLVVAGVTDAATGITTQLVGVQVIGKTTIDANVKVDRPEGVSGEVPVYGAGVSTSVINATLLSSLTDKTTITFPGELRFKSAPDELNFAIKMKPGVYEYFMTQDPENDELMISDTRSSENRWELTAKLDGELTAKDGETTHILPATLIYRDGGKDQDLADTATIKTYNPEKEEKPETEEWDLSSHWWDEGNKDGIFIELQPEPVKIEYVYSADVIWTLNNAP